MIFQKMLLMVACFLLLQTTSASTITVSSLSDTGAGSLREAIANAAAGDSISFAVAGEISLNASLKFDKSLSLFGPGADQLTISGADKVRIMLIDTATVVYISDLTLSHGNAMIDTSYQFAGGGALRNFGEVIFEKCVFLANSGAFGGAILNSGENGGNAIITLNDCAFVNNTATPPATIDVSPIPEAGGAIFTEGRFGGRGKILAINTTFSGNKASKTGGAVQIFQDETDSTRSFVCIHCTITDNEADEAGGVDAAKFGLTYYKNTIIAGNRGRINNPNVFGNLHSLGGLMMGKITYGPSINHVRGSKDTLNVDPHLSPLAENGSPVPTHALQCNSLAIDGGVNEAGLPGMDQRGHMRDMAPDMGALERDGGYDASVRSKESDGAGSLRHAVLNACPGDTIQLDQVSGTLWVAEEIFLDKDLSIFGNSSIGVWLKATGRTRIFEVDTSVNIHLQDLTLAYGRPARFGGGAILNKGNLEVQRCTFFQNEAVSGGAIANYGDGAPADLLVVNSTFSENTATLVDGGALDNYSFTHPTSANFQFCTFTLNKAKKRGGAIYNQPMADVTLNHTIVAGNMGDEGNDLYGKVTSEGYNLIGDTTMTAFQTQTGDLVNQDPKLGGLQYHGGLTYTHALGSGSPAIDAGNAASVGLPAVDQRGFGRMANGTPDMGAYEHDPATGLENDLTRHLLTVFPNPCTGIFSLKLPISVITDPEVSVRLVNIMGQEVWRQKVLTANIAGKQFRVNDLPKGMYQVLVSTSIGEFGQKIILK